MNIQKIIDELIKFDISYALLDEDREDVRILISETNREDFKKTASKAGWKRMKDKSEDLYLYGMKHFLYYLVEDSKLTICFQIACRSTLNGGWVPLDRKINEQALDRTRMEKGVCHLETEDELCYLLAKCVYTNKCFKKTDIKRIEKSMTVADRKRLLSKLESVFFKYTDRMMSLLDNKNYDDIIEALWRFAEY